MVDWVPLQYQVSTGVNYSINPTTFVEMSYGFFRNDITKFFNYEPQAEYLPAN